MEKIHIIIGPTASGKTSYSVELAKQIDGEVINTDAFQFYKGMDIGVAKITEEEMQGVKHHLLSFLEPTEEMDIAKFQKLCREKITEVIARGKVPILVGGSGLYVNSVIFDYHLTKYVDLEYREYINSFTKEHRHEALKAVDPEYAAITDINNEKRVIRALEFFHTHHKKFSQNTGDTTLIYDVESHYITICSDELRKRITERVNFMVENGLIEEVEKLRAKNITNKCKSQQGIGYKEVHQYLDEHQDIEHLKRTLIHNTAKLAKRQKTWFRNKTIPFLGDNMNKAHAAWVESNIKPEYVELIKNYNEQKINENFAGELEFGTAGIRAIMDLGTSKLNEYTITKITLGLAGHYKSGKCVIGYDNRNNSFEFANIVAKVLASKNIEVYLFNELRPTPYVSYAIRQLKADFGIILTASHNPKEYNGYKVYNSTGAQILSDDVNSIKENIAKVEDYINYYNHLAESYDNIIDATAQIDAEYMEALNDIKLRKDLNLDAKVVYSPLHGTGDTILLPFAKANNINLVPAEKECIHDGNFPNIITPNPESTDAFAGIVKLADEVESGLAICTDPDADRLGVAIKHNDAWIYLNGNETAYVTLNYIIDFYKEQNIDLSKYYAVSTVVSSNNVNKMCARNDIEVLRTLTGFKFIGDLVENKHDKEYLFGFEESYGSLFKSFARDKDAMQASLLLVEAYNFFKNQDITLYDYLLSCYEKDGYFKDSQVVIDLNKTDLDVAQIIEKTNAAFSKQQDDLITTIEDYREDKIFSNGEVVGAINLPINEMVKINFESLSFIAIRPSGTEPKIKIYISVTADSFENCDLKISKIKNIIEQEVLV